MYSSFRFPFKDLRIGQLKIAKEVYNAIKDKKWLIIEAPNGAGKTAAILSGAFKAIEELNYRIIFLTRTRKQIEHLYNEVLKFRKIYPRFSSSPTLSYRDGCHLHKIKNPNLVDEAIPIFCRISTKTFSCPFYSNSFFRVPIDMPLSEFVSLSKTKRFCPIEVLKKINMSSDIIIAPYTLFLEMKRKHPFFITNNRKNAIIIDEAHNFPKFLMKTSVKITESDLENLYILFSRLSIKDLSLFISSLRLWCLNHKNGTEMRLEPFLYVTGIKDNLFRLIDIFNYSLNDFYNFLSFKESILIVKLLSFLEFIQENKSSESSFIILRKENDGGILELVEHDPEKTFKKVIKKLDNTPLIFSSATYLSISSFIEELGLYGSRIIEIKSDPLERSCLTIVDPTLSTEKNERTDALFLSISKKILGIYETLGGPLPVFFTSYSMLRATLNKISRDNLSLIIVEKGREEIEEMRAKVEELITKSKILFAVLGGKYSEGIEFPNEKVNKMIIVGLPFPPPTQELKRRIRIKKEKRGWKYAFLTEMLIPTVSKVVQASGRLFREKGRRGTVYLLDKRYLRKDVYSLLPFWLKENLIVSFVELNNLVIN